MGSTQSTEIDPPEIPKIIKIGAYGDGAVGKTQLIQRACYNNFYQENEWTITDDNAMNITINDTEITLQILDTGGSYGIEFVDADWFKQCDAHLLCFDPCSRITFDVVIILYQKLINIKKQQFEEENHKKQFVLDPVALVCTKCEDERFSYKQREVQKSEAAKFANENNMLYIECSAKNNKNCQLCFELITKEAVKSVVSNKRNTKKHVNIHKAKLITDTDHNNAYKNYSDALIPPNMNVSKPKLKSNYSNPLKLSSKLKLRDTKSNDDRSLFMKKNKKKQNIKNNRAFPKRLALSLKEQRQMILFGFVRIKCKMNPENIPQDVISVCDRFYGRSDEWDMNISDPRLIHSKEQVIISKPSNCRVIAKFYGFGAAVVQYGQGRRWIFEIIEKDANYSRVSINIGIIDRDVLYGKYFNFEVNNDFLYDSSSIKLIAKNGKICDGYNIKSYCKPLKVGDIVEMELDMKGKKGNIEGINKQGTLRYIINSMDQGIAFNNINVTKYYSLYVAFERNDSMKIITNFDQ